jgi:biopolymer transport protein ExbD
MADVNINNTQNKNRGRRVNTQVDLTAMVDLGFLLITFFMLATTMVKPKSMEVYKPINDDEPLDIPESKSISIMLGSNGKVYYYVAPNDAKTTTEVIIDSTSYGATGLRKVIQKRQTEVMNKYGQDHKEDLFVMIKPTSKSILKNTIDALDEMQINGVKRFAILEPNAEVDKLVAVQVKQPL